MLEVEAEAACPRCAEGKGCGAGIFSGPGKRRRIDASVDGDFELQEGDRVSFALAPQKLLQAAVVVYGYPLAAGVTGALVAFAAGLGDLGAAVAALAGMVAGFGFARTRLRHQRCLRDFTPVVVANLDAGGQKL